ncbi:MAG: DUF2029 domain-containing protein [Phycisphaeraceae bacterium]|nr:MAG: DUF2029 domain-containing protein [Phycisphaeraceae bacterium]
MKKKLALIWGAWFALFVWFAEGVSARMGRADLTDDRRYRDFYEFYAGSHALMVGDDIYSAGVLGYVYPPLFAFLLTPLAGLPIATAAWIWLAVKLVLLALCIWLGVREVVDRLGTPARGHIAAGVALVGLLFVVDKVRIEMNMQQCNLILLLSFILGLRWIDRRPLLAGVAVGFGANFKYLTLICVPYFLIRGRYKAAVSSVVSTIGWALVPAIGLGWSQNMDLLRRAVLGLGNLGGPETANADAAGVFHAAFGLSIPSFAARYFGENGHNAGTLTFIAAVALAIAGIAWLCYRGSGTNLFLGRNGPARSSEASRRAVLLEWCGLIVAALVFGPQTNSPHLSMLLFPCMAAAGILLSPTCGVTRKPLWIGTALMIAGLVLPPGGVVSDEIVELWRSLSGAAWLILPFFITLLWTGLRYGRGAATGDGPAMAAAGT